MAAALAQQDAGPGPLLRPVKGRRIQPADRPLSRHAITAVVRTAARRAGISHPERYSAHSLRAGGATSAFAARVPTSEIARRGDWSINSPVLYGYLRLAEDLAYPMDQIGY